MIFKSEQTEREGGKFKYFISDSKSIFNVKQYKTIHHNIIVNIYIYADIYLSLQVAQQSRENEQCVE